MIGLDDIGLGAAVDARSVRDPAWAWDELVLACDLVAGHGWHELPSEHPLVVELSGLLRSLPIHPIAARGTKFRSPDSVRRKMADLATRHPASARRPTNGGQLDLEVLNAFLERAEEMHAIATLLRSGTDTGEFDDLPDADDSEIDDCCPRWWHQRRGDHRSGVRSLVTGGTSLTPEVLRALVTIVARLPDWELAACGRVPLQFVDG